MQVAALHDNFARARADAYGRVVSFPAETRPIDAQSALEEVHVHLASESREFAIADAHAGTFIDPDHSRSAASPEIDVLDDHMLRAFDRQGRVRGGVCERTPVLRRVSHPSVRTPLRRNLDGECCGRRVYFHRAGYGHLAFPGAERAFGERTPDRRDVHLVSRVLRQAQNRGAAILGFGKVGQLRHGMPGLLAAPAPIEANVRNFPAGAPADAAGAECRPQTKFALSHGRDLPQAYRWRNLIVRSLARDRDGGGQQNSRPKANVFAEKRPAYRHASPEGCLLADILCLFCRTFHRVLFFLSIHGRQ